MPCYKCTDCKTPLGNASVENYGDVLYCGQCRGAYRPDGARIEIIEFPAFLEHGRLVVNDAGHVMRL